MANKNYLVIDGNYFGHRLLHGMRSNNKEMNLNTLVEQTNFASGLNDSLYNLYASFNNEFHVLLDNIIFVFDNHSWRKDIEPFHPYYVLDTELEPIGYKANRAALKEESDINWDIFDTLMHEFHSRVVDLIVSFRIHGGEGDDMMLLVTEELSAEGITSWVLCTDGDIAQLANNKVIVFKNIKSKLCPEGEFVLSKGLYNEMFSENLDGDEMLRRMTQQRPDTTHYSNMFRVSLNGGKYRSNVVRKPGTGIELAQPILTGLMKTICGDKKDNVFPIVRWVKNGKNYKITEKMVETIWKNLGYGPLNEETAKRVILDKDMQVATILNIIKKAEENWVGEPINKKRVGEHYKHNMRIIFLRKENVPDYVKEGFRNYYSVVRDRIMKTMTIEDMLRMNLQVNQVDSATEMIVSSIPGLDIVEKYSGVPKVAENAIPQETNSYRDVIDDILGM